MEWLRGLTGKEIYWDTDQISDSEAFWLRVNIALFSLSEGKVISSTCAACHEAMNYVLEPKLWIKTVS